MAISDVTWKGVGLATVGDVADALLGLASETEARQFLEQIHAAAGPDGCADIGYVIGYFDDDTRKRLYGWLKIGHPIFGSPV